MTLMRRMLAGLTLALTLAVSGTLLLFASRCVNAKQYHLPQPGVLACHRHLPVSHVPLWRVVTTSLVPSGLLLLGWWLKRWAVRPLGGGVCRFFARQVAAAPWAAGIVAIRRQIFWCKPWRTDSREGSRRLGDAPGFLGYSASVNFPVTMTSQATSLCLNFHHHPTPGVENPCRQR